jgi:hypothetical protein
MQLGDIDKAMEQLNHALTLDSNLRQAALAILQLNDIKHHLDPNDPAQIARRKALQANEPAETAPAQEIAAAKAPMPAPATPTPTAPTRAMPGAETQVVQSERPAPTPANESSASEATPTTVSTPSILSNAMSVARRTRYQTAPLPAVAHSSASPKPASLSTARVLIPEPRVPQPSPSLHHRNERIATLPARSPAPAALVGTDRTLEENAGIKPELKPASSPPATTSYPLAEMDDGSPAHFEPTKAVPVATVVFDKLPAVPSHPLPAPDRDRAISVVPASAQVSVPLTEPKSPLMVVRSSPPLAVVAKAENPVKVFTPSARLQQAREQDREENEPNPSSAAETLIHNTFVAPKISEEMISLTGEDLVVPSDGLLSHSEMLRSTVAIDDAPASDTSKRPAPIRRSVAATRRSSNQAPEEFPQERIPRAEDFVPVQGRTNQLPTYQLYPTAQPTWTPQDAAIQNAGSQNAGSQYGAAPHKSKRQAPVRVRVSSE